MEFEVGEREAREYLRLTPRDLWPDFLKDCSLLKKTPSGETNPMKWRLGYEADMYWHLPADIVAKLLGFLRMEYQVG